MLDLFSLSLSVQLSLSKPFDQPLHGALAIGTVTEGCKTEVTFSAGPESNTWSANDVRTVQQFIEELPTGGTFGCAQPYVRCIDATEDLHAHR